MKKILKKLLTLTAIALIAASCNNEDAAQIEFTGSGKYLPGVWTIVTATRNEADITAMMNFSEFRLNLNPDGTYTIDSYLPFLIRENGAWSIDDPDFPLTLTFKGNSAAEPLVYDFSYPAVAGSMRQFSLTFSPGCTANTYTYTFVKASSNP